MPGDQSSAPIREVTSQLCGTDRDRGMPHSAAPPTPPGIRVRTTAVGELGYHAPNKDGRPSDLKYALRALTRGPCSGLVAKGHGRYRQRCAPCAPGPRLRPAPLDAAAVFSTAARERPAVAAGPSE